MIEPKANKSFAKEVRWALYHLYDPGALKKSPLFPLLGLRRNPQALKEAILEAVGRLKPSSGMSPDSDVWRNYHILQQRFVYQFNQTEVAASLGLSLRQMRRQESIALQVLTYEMCRQYAISDGADTPSTTPKADLHDVVQKALNTLDPLLKASQIAAENRIPANQHFINTPEETLRQAMLIFLAQTIQQAGLTTIVLEGSQAGAETSLNIRWISKDLGEEVSDESNLALSYS